MSSFGFSEARPGRSRSRPIYPLARAGGLRLPDVTIGVPRPEVVFVSEFLGERGTTSTEEGAPDDDVRLAKWILLVEDDQDTREVLVDFLGEAGYHAKAVASGAAAMEILETGRPCLILADYLLEDTDGKELRRKIRESLGAAAPPFVLLTGFSAANLKDISGVILQKPIDCDRLLDVVAEHCTC
jgi:CheY-like chemotaxis protein